MTPPVNNKLATPESLLVLLNEFMSPKVQELLLIISKELELKAAQGSSSVEICVSKEFNKITHSLAVNNSIV